MPRDIPVGNGQMLVAFDDFYHLRDFYYPHVGQENHAGKSPFRFGVWAGAACGGNPGLSWVHDAGWERHLDYEDETLLTRVALRNEALGIELLCTDTVDFHLNVYIRRILARNLVPRAREILLFFHHDFGISGHAVGDTAYFDPATRCLIHYKGSRYFLVNCCGPDRCGIESFATGAAGYGGFEGTWRDAEDGALSNNPIAQGSVDSIFLIPVALESHGEAESHYWIIAGKDYAEVSSQDKLVLSKRPEDLLVRTRDYWRCWVNKGEVSFDGLPAEVVRLYKRSLLTLTTQIDEGGAVMAANDTDYLRFSSDTYSYCWPRDGALTCHALDMAGYGHFSRHFFEFCARALRHEGYLLHKYNPDGTVASSWLPWVNTSSPLPIQEDETALVLWALWRHYLLFRDLDFIRPLYRPLIISIGDFLLRYRDTKTGLPFPSWDLWEERSGIHAYTCGAVYGGLTAARNFASMFGQMERAERYGQAMLDLRTAMDAHLWSDSENRFVRSLLPSGDGFVVDMVLDSSIGGLWFFGAYPADDPRVLATARRIREDLLVKTPIGGIARYENDYYFQSSSDIARIPGNPWIICTVWDAQHRIALCKTREELEREALPLLLWVTRQANPSGVLPEQIHPETGAHLSVAPLTWSHASVVDVVNDWILRWESLR